MFKCDGISTKKIIGRIRNRELSKKFYTFSVDDDSIFVRVPHKRHVHFIFIRVTFTPLIFTIHATTCLSKNLNGSTFYDRLAYKIYFITKYTL